MPTHGAAGIDVFAFGGCGGDQRDGAHDAYLPIDDLASQYVTDGNQTLIKPEIGI